MFQGFFFIYHFWGFFGFWFVVVVVVVGWLVDFEIGSSTVSLAGP